MSAVVDVVTGPLRVRIESAAPRLTAARLAALLRPFAAAPAGRAAARLLVLEVPDRRTGRPRRLPAAARRCLAPILDRLGGGRQRHAAEVDARGGLDDPTTRALAERVLASAREPVLFGWVEGLLVGDLATGCATLAVLESVRTAAAWRRILGNGYGVLLAAAAARRGGLLVHGAGLVRHGRGYLFVGRSGAGKTTLARRHAGAALCDEGTLVVGAGDGFVVAGTPLHQLPGAPRAAGGAAAPLAGLLFLTRGRRTVATRLRPVLAAAGLAGRHLQFLPLLPPALAARALATAAALAARVPAGRLARTREGRVWAALAAAGL
jgi:hypothetical protein